MTCIRCNHFHAKASEFVHIILHDRIQIHLGIHRRCNNFFAAACHYRGCKHIIRYAVRYLSYYIGRCRCNQHQIGFLRQRYMLHIVLEITIEGIDQTFISGQCFKCNRIYEISCICGHKNRNLCMKFSKHTGKICYLVCRNAPSYRQYDIFSF